MNAPAPDAGLDDLILRLSSDAPGARRVAILDLIALSIRDPRASAALESHLPNEHDERAALLVIRHLASAGRRGAMPRLLAMYQDRGTPVAIAHAAILAHDSLAAMSAPGH